MQHKLKRRPSALVAPHVRSVHSFGMNFQPVASETDPLLSAGTVAEIVGLSPSTLRRYRAEGSGPPWVRVGQRLIRYPRSGVREWIAQQTGTAVA